MKRVKIAYTVEEFEEFINRRDINILQVDVKAVEQSFIFQEGFMGIVYYEDVANGEKFNFLESPIEARIKFDAAMRKNDEIKNRSLFDRFKHLISKNYGQAKS
jgi:hypothetical protein